MIILLSRWRCGISEGCGHKDDPYLNEFGTMNIFLVIAFVILYYNNKIYTVPGSITFTIGKSSVPPYPVLVTVNLAAAPDMILSFLSPDIIMVQYCSVRIQKKIGI